VSLARTYARTASAAYADAAAYLRALPEQEWTGPTGCAEWDVRTLAGHIAGEAVWFPTLTRGITRHAPPRPDAYYESLKTLPPREMADTIGHAAEEIVATIEDATPAQLRVEADLGWARMPLGRATYVALMEAVYHDWDLHIGRDPAATIPTAWARTVARDTATFAPQVARRDGLAAAPGRYVLQVGDGVGPLTLTVAGGQLAVAPGTHGTADVTLHLTADQYVRLVAGRLPLERALEQGLVTAEGDRQRAGGLTRIFRGFANEG
jgi:uncharacterized protein (TIGR03083 family)